MRFFGIFVLLIVGMVIIQKQGLCMDRKNKEKVYFYKRGKLVEERIEAGNALSFLYNSSLGTMLRFIIRQRFVAQLYGYYQDSSLSKKDIGPFIKKHAIVMNDFIVPAEGYTSFNDFFIRKLKPGARLVDSHEDSVVTPADGKVIVVPDISQNVPFFVKNEKFNMVEFLQSDSMAKLYEKGTLVIVRLAPPDYHRFHLPIDGYINKPIFINGIYESVNPIVYAAGVQPLLQNERQLIMVDSERYGKVAIIHVGATFVGKIKFTCLFGEYGKKGDELGYFEFGGSTVVLLFQAGAVSMREDILHNSANGYETSVVMGEKIAEINKDCMVIA